MTAIPTTTEDQRHLRTLKTLAVGAVLTTLIAIAAGIVLIIADPQAGSSFEAALGFTAAVAGLTTAALAVSAAIYAQVRNLWKYVPTWLRMIAWALILYGIAMTLWNLVDQIS